jgi:hypothetical protein
MSIYDLQKEEVAAYEESLGSHGGRAVVIIPFYSVSAE